MNFKIDEALHISLMYNIYSFGPKIEPCGKPQVIHLSEQIVFCRKTEQQDLCQQAKDLEGTVTLGGDGWADSPGHCVKYGTYTMMELRLGKVIDVQLVQVKLRKRCMEGKCIHDSC